MPSGKYNLIQLGGHYFTSTGMESGTVCRTSIFGLKALKRRMVGQTIVPIEGAPWSHVYPVSGLPLDFTVFRITSAVYTTVTDSIRAAVQAGTHMSLNITGGAYGDFYLTVQPVLNADDDGEDVMTSGIVNDIPFSFIVVTSNDLFSITPGAVSLTGQNVTLTAG